MTLPATPSSACTPLPTVEQQLVLNRIAQQRERLRASRAACCRALVSVDDGAAAGDYESLALRAIWFVRQHPRAVAAMMALAAVAGPRRLMRWTGVLLPMLVRIRR